MCIVVYIVMLTLVPVCTGEHDYCYGSRKTTELGAARTHFLTESLCASTTPRRVVPVVSVCVCVCARARVFVCSGKSRLRDSASHVLRRRKSSGLKRSSCTARALLCTARGAAARHHIRLAVNVDTEGTVPTAHAPEL